MGKNAGLLKWKCRILSHCEVIGRIRYFVSGKFQLAESIFLSFVLLLQAFATELCFPPCSAPPWLTYGKGFFRLGPMQSVL